MRYSEIIGCDIIEIDRISRSINKFGDSFISKILSEKEIEEYKFRKKSLTYISGRFAAKEAVSKALGTGFHADLFFTDISILSNPLGVPEVYIKNKRRVDIHVTISHSKSNAISFALIK